MNRRERRHPEQIDPIARAQEEARWSSFTFHLRATNQGKLLFPSRHARGWRAIGIKVIAWMVLAPLVLAAIVGVVALIKAIL